MLTQYAAAPGHTGSIYGVAVAAAVPHLLASASDDETVRLWEQRDGSSWRQASRVATGDSAMCVSFCRDGSMLAADSAGAADGVASLYRVHCSASADDRSSLNSTVHLRGHPEEVYGCEWVAGQGGLLCTASGDSLFLWDAEAGCLLQQCEPPHVGADPLSAAMPEVWQEGYIFSLRQQPEGISSGLMAGACSDGALRVWTTGSGQLEALWGARVHGGIASSCTFSADGLQLASTSKDGHVVVLVHAFTCYVEN